MSFGRLHRITSIAAVFETVEAEVTARIGSAVAAGGSTDPIEMMQQGAHTWLDACAEPDVHRIMLLEAPAVLGWERWREIGLRYGLDSSRACSPMRSRWAGCPRSRCCRWRTC